VKGLELEYTVETETMDALSRVTRNGEMLRLRIKYADMTQNAIPVAAGGICMSWVPAELYRRENDVKLSTTRGKEEELTVMPKSKMRKVCIVLTPQAETLHTIQKRVKA